MLTKEVAKIVQDMLHDEAIKLNIDVVFNIVDDIQQYSTDMENKDGNKYTPAVLTLSNTPFVFNSLDIKIYRYRLSLYGWSAERHDVEKLFQSLSTQNSPTIYFSDLVDKSFGSSEGGRLQRRFEAYADIELHIPASVDNEEVVSGISTNLDIDSITIPFNTIRFRKDKSLIPNVMFGGENTDVKLISETIQLEIPIIASNSKIIELLTDVLNDNYNKKYTITYEVVNIIKTVDMVLRVGTIEYNRNNQPITFWITLERALTRKLFVVDGKTIPVLRWSFAGNTEITSTTKGDIVKSKPVSSARSINVLFLNDGSSKINELIEAIDMHNKSKRFAVSFGINDTLKLYSMIVRNGNIQVTEHPDLIIEVEFVEGVSL